MNTHFIFNEFTTRDIYIVNHVNNFTLCKESYFKIYYKKYYKKYVKYCKTYIKPDILSNKYIQIGNSLLNNSFLILSKIINTMQQNNLNKTNILLDTFLYNDHCIRMTSLMFMMDFDKKHNYCFICKTPVLVEPFIKCGYNVEIMIDTITNKNINRNLTVGKLPSNRLNVFTNKYKVYPSDYQINTTQLNKYDVIIHNLSVSISYTFYDNMLDTIKQREITNYDALKDMYRITKHINIGGKLIFHYPFISTKSTMILLENIFNCFKKISRPLILRNIL